MGNSFSENEINLNYQGEICGKIYIRLLLNIDISINFGILQHQENLIETGFDPIISNNYENNYMFHKLINNNIKINHNLDDNNSNSCFSLLNNKNNISAFDDIRYNQFDKPNFQSNNSDNTMKKESNLDEEIFGKPCFENPNGFSALPNQNVYQNSNFNMSDFPPLDINCVNQYSEKKYNKYFINNYFNNFYD